MTDWSSWRSGSRTTAGREGSGQRRQVLNERRPKQSPGVGPAMCGRSVDAAGAAETEVDAPGQWIQTVADEAANVLGWAHP